jgi:N-acetylglutamate synthase-like GNAT family acetyltransferase
MINIKDYKDIEVAINYYHSKWGNKSNFNFFYDAIINSSKTADALPRFYLLLQDDKIIGCCGLVTNDFISRHDLYPWLAGIYIEENERGKQFGNFMMEYLEKEAKRIGFSTVYLTTNHSGYYERYNWQRMEDGYDLSNKPTRIYYKEL